MQSHDNDHTSDLLQVSFDHKQEIHNKMDNQSYCKWNIMPLLHLDNLDTKLCSFFNKNSMGKLSCSANFGELHSVRMLWLKAATNGETKRTAAIANNIIFFILFPHLFYLYMEP